MTPRLSPQRMALVGVGVLVLVVAIGASFLPNATPGDTRKRASATGRRALRRSASTRSPWPRRTTR